MSNRQRKALESFMNRSKSALSDKEVKVEDKGEGEANSKQEPLSKSEAQYQAEAKQESEAKSEVKPQDKQQGDTDANTEAFSESQVQVQKQLDDEVEVKEQTQEEEEVELDDPALKFIAKAQKGRKKQRMEDIMVKRTHWYKKEDLRKIEQLSQMTGESKYQVISTAINSLYLRVMERKKKKP